MEIDFKKFGLSVKEALIYKVLVELGPSSVFEITNLAGINRTTGYDILNKLIEKKLISLSQKGKRKVYLAENPEKLVEYLENRIKALERKLKDLQIILPEIKAIYNTVGIKPKVKYYEGIEGLKQVYEDSLGAHGVIKAYASIEDIRKILPDYAEEYFKRRAAKRIYIRSIVKTSPYAIQLKRIQDKFFREVLLVPPDKFNLSLEAYIYDDKVSFISVKEKFGIIIESKEIANAQRALYELAWQRAKDFDREEERKLRTKRKSRAVFARI